MSASSLPDERRAARRALARRALGAQLRRARRAADLTQLELSALSGIGINTITRCERGSMAVTLDTLDRLAEVLRCDFVVAAAPLASDEHGESARPADADPQGDRGQGPGEGSGYDLGE